MNKKKAIRHILVVDDEPGICTMLTRFLRSCGYDCESTTDPVKALSILKEQDFELAILDIRMAGMDGLQLLNQISKTDLQLDTIIMTGFTADYSYSEVIEAGATDFIAKPFQMPELKAKIERVNRERKMMSDLKDLNTVLGVLLQREQRERENIANEAVSHLRELVFPYLDKLKNSRLSAEQKQHVKMIESNLAELCSPFLRNLSARHAHISSMEIQVANLVKAGKGNKEISEILSISPYTVMTHRHHLRSKLGLKGEKINLRSYLNSIEF
jgi:DNA-binding response OmpR family regulator